MPFYDYQCSSCEHTFERLLLVNDPQPRKCPECGALKVKRMMPSKPAKLHMRYSPMHPRYMRGQKK